MRLIIDNTGLDKAKESLENAALAAKNMDKAAASIGSKFLSFVKLGFQLSVDPYGLPWEPLKIRKGKPLRDTGVLMNSFTQEFSGETLRIGTITPYAKTHQDGANITLKVKDNKRVSKLHIGKIVIPARPMLPYDPLGLPKTWADYVDSVMVKHLGGPLNG